MSVVSVVSRTRDSAERLACLLPDATASTHLDALDASVNLVVLCVPDRALESVAIEFARAREDWSGSLIAHVSGVQGASILHAFSARGGEVLAFHPIQSFPRPNDPGALNGCFVGLEGAPEAIAKGSEIARQIGARPVTVAEEDRPLYHLGASIASNFLVTLMHAVERLAAHRNDSSNWSLEAYRPLILRTIDNVMELGAAQALTGPVVRGDLGTIKEHLKELRRTEPELIPLYLTLLGITTDLATESGRCGGPCVEDLTELLKSEAGRIPS